MKKKLRKFTFLTAITLIITGLFQFLMVIPLVGLVTVICQIEEDENALALQGKLDEILNPENDEDLEESQSGIYNLDFDPTATYYDDLHKLICSIDMGDLVIKLTEKGSTNISALDVFSPNSYVPNVSLMSYLYLYKLASEICLRGEINSGNSSGHITPSLLVMLLIEESGTAVLNGISDPLSFREVNISSSYDGYFGMLDTYNTATPGANFTFMYLSKDEAPTLSDDFRAFAGSRLDYEVAVNGNELSTGWTQQPIIALNTQSYASLQESSGSTLSVDDKYKLSATQFYLNWYASANNGYPYTMGYNKEAKTIVPLYSESCNAEITASTTYLDNSFLQGVTPFFTDSPAEHGQLFTSQTDIYANDVRPSTLCLSDAMYTIAILWRFTLDGMTPTSGSSNWGTTNTVVSTAIQNLDSYVNNRELTQSEIDAIKLLLTLSQQNGPNYAAYHVDKNGDLGFVPRLYLDMAYNDIPFSYALSLYNDKSYRQVVTGAMCSGSVFLDAQTLLGVYNTYHLLCIGTLGDSPQTCVQGCLFASTITNCHDTSCTTVDYYSLSVLKRLANSNWMYSFSKINLSEYDTQLNSFLAAPDGANTEYLQKWISTSPTAVEQKYCQSVATSIALTDVGSNGNTNLIQNLRLAAFFGYRIYNYAKVLDNTNGYIIDGIKVLGVHTYDNSGSTAIDKSVSVSVDTSGNVWYTTDLGLSYSPTEEHGDSSLATLWDAAVSDVENCYTLTNDPLMNEGSLILRPLTADSLFFPVQTVEPAEEEYLGLSNNQSATSLVTYGVNSHNGVDIDRPNFQALLPRTKLYSVADGYILAYRVCKINQMAETSNSLGAYITVRSIDEAGNRVDVTYAHLSGFSNVKLGQAVPRGALLGYAGNTGSSQGTHLHIKFAEGDSDTANYVTSAGKKRINSTAVLKYFWSILPADAELMKSVNWTYTTLSTNKDEFWDIYGDPDGTYRETGLNGMFINIDGGSNQTVKET